MKEDKERREYIRSKMVNIDQCIYHGDYRKAFSLFLLTMETLDTRERQEFIDYFNLKLIN